MLTPTPTIETPEANAGDYAATIITVKAARDQARADSIRDLVDAHRRLQGSVRRFLSWFGASADEPLTLDALASRLEARARAAGFRRMRELSETVGAVRAAAHQREWLFSDSFGTDTPALRDAALALERLDARLVGLCVEHVLVVTRRSKA
jgi:hypothetical protein